MPPGLLLKHVSRQRDLQRLSRHASAARLTFTTSSCDLPSVTTTAMRFLTRPPLCDEGKTWSTANLMALPVCRTDDKPAVTSLRVVFSKRGPHEGRLQELAWVLPPMYLTLRMACRSSDTLWCFPRGISSRGVSLYWTTPTCRRRRRGCKHAVRQSQRQLPPWP